MTPVTLYLVRHGENVANVIRFLSCRIVDHDLTDRGQLQAAQLAAHFASVPLEAVYASPLRRARQTAERIAAPHRLDVQLMEELREVDVGDLEIGQTPENLAERRAADNAVVREWVAGRLEHRYPGGENFVEAMARGLHALKTAVSGGHRTVALVGHSGLFQILLPTLQGSVEAALGQRMMPLGSWSRVTVMPDPWQVLDVLWAHDEHLSGEARTQPDRPAHLRSEVPRLSSLEKP